MFQIWSRRSFRRGRRALITIAFETRDMPKKRAIQRIQPEKQEDSVLLKAATTIGKAAGRVMGLIRLDKTSQDPAPRKRIPTSKKKKIQRTVKRRVAPKKTTQKVKKVVRSTSQ